MSRYFPGRSIKDKKILNAYCDIRSKMKEAEKLLAELVENPAQYRRAKVVELELVLAKRGLSDAGFKYVGGAKK